MTPAISPSWSPHFVPVIKSLLSRLRASKSVTVAASSGTDDLVAAASIDAFSCAEPVKRVLLLPMGKIVLRDGRGPFRLDSIAHAREVVAASQARAGRTDLAIDYDHQSYYGAGPGKGGRAPAAGWIKRLSADDAGIWGEVEWTPAADAALRAREYRYISPLFAADKDGRVLLLRNAGLVNDPAIESLPAVAAGTLQDAQMNYSPIAAALCLDASATLEDIVSAIKKLVQGKPDALDAEKLGLANYSPVAVALGLDTTATLEDIIFAIAKLALGSPHVAASALVAAADNPDPAKWVPAATYEVATARLVELEADRRESIIAAASAEGRLTPAMAAIARDHLTNPAVFEAYIAAAMPVVSPGKLEVFHAAGQGGDIVSASSIYIEEQARKGITIDASDAVRHILSTRAF